jgi:hypothetical protein
VNFDSRAARLWQELRHRGRIKTPVIYINNPETDLDEYRLPDWVADALPTISLGRPGGLGGEPESTADWIARLSREAEAVIKARGKGKPDSPV